MSQHKTPIENYALWEEKIKSFESIVLTEEQRTWHIPDGSEKLSLVIVEPRKHPWMKGVLNNMATVYGGKGVPLYIFHGTENLEWLETEICNDWKNVHYASLKCKNIKIEDYNKLFSNPNFYGVFKTSHILVFQTDTFIRYPIPEKYFESDYVGAPWSHRHTLAIPSHSKIGNGGFSLRKVSTMIEICKTHKRPANLNEDVFFAQYVPANKKPTEESAMEFSVEHIYYSNPCGMHQAWRFHSFEHLKALLNF